MQISGHAIPVENDCKTEELPPHVSEEELPPYAPPAPTEPIPDDILRQHSTKPGNRGKQETEYEAKVREVRQAQLRLMEHHSKARRDGMREVSKRAQNP